MNRRRPTACASRLCALALLAGASLAAGAQAPPRTGERGVRAVLADLETKGEAAHAAADRIPLAELRAFVERDLRSGGAFEHGRGALVALGRAGTAREIPLLAKVARASGLAAATDEKIADELERAAGEVLRRDRGGFPAVETLLRENDPALGPPLARAAVSAGSAECLRMFARLLDAPGDLSRLALDHLGLAGEDASRPVETAVLDAVRRRLDADDPGQIQGAALAAGRLEDGASVPRLVRLLESRWPGVRTDALWSLRRISGLDLRGNASAWAAWYESEKSWREREAARALAALRTGTREERTAALREIAGRRCFRDDLALEVASALAAADGPTAALCCDALRQLGSRAAVPGLVECLSRPEPAAREGAWRALRAITGKDLPPRREAWRAIARPR